MSAHVAKVDCTVARDVCTAANIRGYPTIMLFTKGSKEGVRYSGPRETSAFIGESAVRTGTRGMRLILGASLHVLGPSSPSFHESPSLARRAPLTTARSCTPSPLPQTTSSRTLARRPLRPLRNTEAEVY